MLWSNATRINALNLRREGFLIPPPYFSGGGSSPPECHGWHFRMRAAVSRRARKNEKRRNDSSA